MNATDHEFLKKSLNQKTDEDLLAIWQANNRGEWVDEAFAIIQEILVDRGVDIPPQQSSTLPQQRDSAELRCVKCGHIFIFEPSEKKIKCACPRCGTPNPNLRKRYIAIADGLVISFVMTILVLVLAPGWLLGIGGIQITLHIGLALVTIMAVLNVYRSKAPWHTTPGIIWFAIAFGIFVTILMPTFVTWRAVYRAFLFSFSMDSPSVWQCVQCPLSGIFYVLCLLWFSWLRLINRRNAA